MRKVHASFDDEDQYRDTERFANEFLSQSSKANLCMVNSKHNLSVTEKIVTQVMLGKEYSSKGSISCKWDYIHSFYVTLHNFFTFRCC